MLYNSDTIIITILTTMMLPMGSFGRVVPVPAGRTLHVTGKDVLVDDTTAIVDYYGTILTLPMENITMQVSRDVVRRIHGLNGKRGFSTLSHTHTYTM